MKILSRKFISAVFLSFIGVIFALTDKVPSDQVWTGLQLVWGAYAVMNVIDKKLNTPEEE